MYVFCVGMYRACSTWQYEIVAHLLTVHRDGRRLGYLTGDEFAERDEAEGRPSAGWKVLKSHEEHPRFRAALAEGRAVAIYAHRDLRDVVFSLMHKRRLAFEDLLSQGMIHQVLANDRYWMARPHRLVQRYEDLIADPVGGVEQLARFLGIVLDPGEARQIADEYSLNANRLRTRELGHRLRTLGLDLNDPSNAQFADRDTLLHWNHLRDGRVGSWEAEATGRQRLILARLGNRWLRARGYEPDEPERLPKPRRSWRDRLNDEWRIGAGLRPAGSAVPRCDIPGSPRSSRRPSGSARRPAPMPPRCPSRATTPRIGGPPTPSSAEAHAGVHNDAA